MNKRIIVIKTIFLTLCVAGCAHLPRANLPAISKRELHISKQLPGLEFRYKQCIDSFLGVCFNSEDRVEYYDLRNDDVKKLLTDLDFRARSNGGGCYE